MHLTMGAGFVSKTGVYFHGLNTTFEKLFFFFWTYEGQANIDLIVESRFRRPHL